MSQRSIPSPARLAAALAAIAAVVVIAGLLIRLNEHAREADTGGRQANATARVGAPFTLVDSAGRSVSDRDFRGRVVLLMFAGARDGERITSALQVGSAGLDLLDAQQRQRIAPVLVTIPPPIADAPGIDAAEVPPPIQPMPAGWIGLSGAYRDVAALARAYYVPLDEPGRASTRGAPPASSVTALLLDERGAYRSHLVMPNDPTALAQWIAKNL